MNDVDGDEVGAVSCFVKYVNKCGIQYPARMMALEQVKCKSNILLTFILSKFGPNYCNLKSRL